MILFAADNHYDSHPGRALYEEIKGDYDVELQEDAWPAFAEPNLKSRYELLILNMISDSCHVAPPPNSVEPNIRAYVEAGGNIFIAHAGSAAFWQWDWWRPLVGYRWVRGDDADGFEPSSHPTRPYRVTRAKTRHPLAAKLRDVDLPEDEIYVHMEQTCPTTTLMETTTDEGTFPQCYACETPWGGRVLGYLPGHKPEVVRHPDNVANCRVLIDDLLTA